MKRKLPLEKHYDNFLPSLSKRCKFPVSKAHHVYLHNLKQSGRFESCKWKTNSALPHSGMTDPSDDMAAGHGNIIGENAILWAK